MGIITKIEVQKRNKNRVNVYIDNEYSFSCSAELVYSHDLKLKKSVDIDYLKEVVNEDNYLKCKNDALRVIEKTYKSEKELREKLIKKEYEEKIIDRALDFLKEYNFLDDSKYADMYIKDKIKLQGKNKIKYSLIRKGIAEDLIKEKLKAYSGDVELNTALKLAEKKYAILSKNENDSRKLYKKLGDTLLRNGFSGDIASEVLNKVIIHDESKEEKVKAVDEEEVYRAAEKRYNIISKSEKDKRKLYKKLSDYLLRRGYNWDQVKSTVNLLIEGNPPYDES